MKSKKRDKKRDKAISKSKKRARDKTKGIYLVLGLTNSLLANFLFFLYTFIVTSCS